MKILLIAGHGASDPGACSSYGQEATETRKVVNELVNQFKGYKDIQVTVYPTNRNCYADVCNGCVQVNMSAFDYIFEVHFNSATASARGTEIWVTPQESGISVEQNIVKKISALGFVNRGVKREQFAVINYAKNRGVSSALVEVCFISNSIDMTTYRNKFKDICKAIVEGIAEGFEINGVPNVTQTTPKQSTPVSSSKDYDEDGIFYFNTTVKIRTSPDIRSDNYTGICYYAGENVTYHHVYLNRNGYNWIQYTRGNGTQGYCAIRDLSTGEKYGYAE